jgi:hypothetical protein
MLILFRFFWQTELRDFELTLRYSMRVILNHYINELDESLALPEYIVDSRLELS